MEAGVTYLAPVGSAPVRLARGMAVFDADGEPAGWVAAVVVDAGSQMATQLLVRTHQWFDSYHLAPVTLIAVVVEDMIYLSLAIHEIGELPLHYPA
jgi:hypothetical protein